MLSLPGLASPVVSLQPSFLGPGALSWGGGWGLTEELGHGRGVGAKRGLDTSSTPCWPADPLAPAVSAGVRSRSGLGPLVTQGTCVALPSLPQVLLGKSQQDATAPVLSDTLHFVLLLEHVSVMQKFQDVSTGPRRTGLWDQSCCCFQIGGGQQSPFLKPPPPPAQSQTPGCSFAL